MVKGGYNITLLGENKPKKIEESSFAKKVLLRYNIKINV